MPKFKTKIKKPEFYTLLFLIFLFVLLLLIWVLIPFTIGYKKPEYVPSKTDLSEEEFYSKLGSEIATIKLLTYIGNSLILIFFVVYIILARHKIKLGYGFFITWIIIFIILSTMPFIRGISQMHVIELWVGSLITVVNILLIITLSYLTFKLHVDRKIHNYQWYKIHKGKGT
ncbi:hypothetical protein [Mycoplasmopsis gallinacea]|uniref:Uncharacterized protein n=1 Tax=Mycoplasmopsis gallinacea TaxID=29556 RepID=A0A449A329_9BACT|nr:hypothetical protein [Mycoplasmopsis gallinacea]VEU58655.1 Uncharacterised protein [Mycoplasmopsis gallinacea]